MFRRSLFYLILLPLQAVDVAEHVMRQINMTALATDGQKIIKSFQTLLDSLRPLLGKAGDISLQKIWDASSDLLAAIYGLMDGLQHAPQDVSSLAFSGLVSGVLFFVCLFVCLNHINVPVQHMQAIQGQTESC